MMLKELCLWEEKIKEGLALANNFYQNHGASLPKNVRKIVFVGMGGSAIAGKIFKTFLDYSTDIAVTILDSPILPKHIDTVTLAIVVSYSGNTWETIEILNQLTEKFIPTIVIAHGGKAIEKAEIKNLPFVLLPNSLTPRSSLGNTLGFLGGLLANFGLIMAIEWAIGWAEQAKKYTSLMVERYFFDDFLNIIEKTEFFYVWGVVSDSASVAYRAATQFHENSKVPVAFAEYPELAHNLLVGLSAVKNPPLVVMFHTDYLPASLRIGIQTVEEILKEKRIILYKPPILGDTFHHQVFTMILWADFASYHLAKMRNIEVERVQVIDDLKRRHQEKNK